MTRRKARLDKDIEKATTAERLFEDYDYKFPDFEAFSLEPKLLKERVIEADKFSNRICFIRQNIPLFNLVKARIKELGLSNQDIGYYLRTDRGNVHKFFKRGQSGSLSQAKYLLLLELLNIQVKMTFSIVENFDRNARYGVQKKED